LVSGFVACDGIWSVVARQKLQHTGAMWSRPTHSKNDSDGSSSSSSSSNSSSGVGQAAADIDATGSGMRYLGVMIVLGICRSSQLLRFPVTDGKTVFQTMDGSTRMYCMPFVDDTHPLFAWRGGGGCSSGTVCYMWQLSFPLPLQQSQALAGDKVRLKELALQVLWVGGCECIQARY